jgi:hypothetical protein
MDVIFTPGAGLDVRKKTVMACRLTPDPTGQQAEDSIEGQAFGTRTVAWLAWSDWLAQAGMTHVAMERTGEYGTPVYNLVAGDATLVLVNAVHVPQGPGRQTDKAAARWLAKLMRHGLLQASFIPPVEPREWRDLTRYRTTLGQERGRVVNRVHGVLERAHINLASVATDVMGVSGRAMLAAVVEGRADPAMRAEVATGRMRSKIPFLEQALTGLVRTHHRPWLALQRAPSAVLDEPTAPLADTAGAPGSTEEASAPAIPLPVPRAIRVLDTMPGVDQRGAAGGRVGDRPGARGHRRPPRGLEWGRPRPQRTRGPAALRQDPARASGPADRSHAMGPCRRPSGDLRVGPVSAPGRAPGQDTRHDGGGPCARRPCLP